MQLVFSLEQPSSALLAPPFCKRQDSNVNLIIIEPLDAHQVKNIITLSTTTPHNLKNWSLTHSNQNKLLNNPKPLYQWQTKKKMRKTKVKSTKERKWEIKCKCSNRIIMFPIICQHNNNLSFCICSKNYYPLAFLAAPDKTPFHCKLIDRMEKNGNGSMLV